MTATYFGKSAPHYRTRTAAESTRWLREALIEVLAADLTAGVGRGFLRTNLKQMREFCLAWPIRQTLSDESASRASAGAKLEKRQTPSAELAEAEPQVLLGEVAMRDPRGR